MATKKKKNHVGRLGPRYGKKIRDRMSKVEQFQRKKQECPYCQRKGLKRLSKGIWFCKRCDKKFASDTYFVTEKFVEDKTSTPKKERKQETPKSKISKKITQNKPDKAKTKK